MKILEYLSLVYQGKRFAGSYAYESEWVLSRRHYPEQRWQELCEEYGHDPDVERIEVGTYRPDSPPKQAPIRHAGWQCL